MKFNIKYSLFLIMLFPFFASGQNTIDDVLQKYNTRSIPYISVEELRMLQLHDTLQILDAREPEEFLVSHIASARNVGFNTFSSKEISEKIIDKTTPIIVYCSLGIRSEEIGEKLKKEGFTNIKNLYGGIFEWKNKEYPVLDSTGIETEKVHTFSKLWSKWLLKGEKVY